MSLINCPECGKQISDKSPSCIHCGLPSSLYFTLKDTQERLKGQLINDDILQYQAFSEYLTRYSSIADKTQEVHNQLLSCGFKCQKYHEKFKYLVGNEVIFHLYPSLNQANNVTLLCLRPGKPQWISFTPETDLQKIKNLVSRVASESGLNNSSTITNEDQTEEPINYKELKNALISFEIDYNQLISGDRYISNGEVSKFKEVYNKYLDTLNNPLILQFIKTNAATFKIDDIHVDRFLNKMKNLDKNIEIHNNNFVDRKLQEYKDYFDNMLREVDPNIRLDEEQRKAIITDDNHCLLVAGAGAGKTTTMAAKVKYLVEKQGVNPQDIIVISYTNKAIDELKERINDRLKISAKINTFHSFAYEIVKKSVSDAPEINFSAYKIVADILEKTIFEDKKLMRNLVLFLGYYFDLPQNIFEFKNLNDYHTYKAALDFETLKSGLGEYIKRVENQRSKYVKTLTGEYLRSAQEVQIANILYLHGIDYEYERIYPYEIYNSKKKYTPDFYIRQGENECYIEHFGITESLKSNIYTQKQLVKYKKGILDKRELHKNFKTNLIETWAEYRDNRSLKEHLEEELVKKGFVLKERNQEEVYKKIVETGKDKYIYKLVTFMLEFIEQFKTCGYDADGFDELRKKTDNARTQLFLEIAEQVYNYYQETLKSRNQIDFADMINFANFYLIQMEDTKYDLPYKYIIIDEFQDIARQRFNLTKRLAQITGAKVVAVGDDWQSIYAFAGSDITLFTKFIELMGHGTELKITHTYRNSQELIDIAGNFIQKNSAQISKQLISPKHLKDPVLLECFDDSTKFQKNLAEAITKAIGKILNEFGNKSSILLIGRYNFDMYKLYMTEEFRELPNNKVRCKKFPDANITFMTAHSSKGLGFDNVIVLSMTENKFGFPCQIEDDPIMKMVRYEDKSVDFAEERRLFYVALTRTKNRVYIAAPLNRPSRFLLELIKDYNLPHDEKMNLDFVDAFKMRCPVCNFPLKYEFNKNYGLSLLICTNESEICDFMTNDKVIRKDIFKCSKCKDGYMIVKKNPNNSEYFYGCTNYVDRNTGCHYMIPIKKE